MHDEYDDGYHDEEEDDLAEFLDDPDDDRPLEEKVEAMLNRLETMSFADQLRKARKLIERARTYSGLGKRLLDLLFYALADALLNETETEDFLKLIEESSSFGELAKRYFVD